MITSRAQFNLAEAPLPTMNWCFEDGEHTDIESLSCPICGYSSSRPVLPEMAFTGDQRCPLHTNPYHNNGFNPLYPGQVHTFLQRIPYHYQIGQALHPAPHRQYDHEMAAVYEHPISPISEYESNPIKTADGEFSSLHHSTPEDGIHQPHHHQSPAYLPPNSFLLSSTTPSQRNFFPSPDSPLSTPFHSPTKQEEEEYMDVSEPFASPLTMAAEPIDDFMAQGVDEEEDESDLKESDQHYSVEQGQGQLGTPVLPCDDIDYDKAAPYAVLIHRALMSTPRRRMVLAEIYAYFREKIPRFKKVKGRGWMNSIRHNLSMNGAFLKEDRPPDDPGKGYIWVLSEEAVKEGVKSTTRYRKSPPNSKKRTTDEVFLRGSAGRRRRKSTRKWTTAKSRSRSQSSTTTIKEGEHERETTQSPTTPALQHEISTPPPTEALINYTLEPSEHSIIPGNPQALDYSNCYASFPHFDASSRLYNSDDDDDEWCFSGPGTGNHFREEYTLVTLDSQH